MRFMPIKYAEPGMRVARSLRNSQGNIMITDGAVLNETMINKLKELGFIGFYVDDKWSKEIEVEDMISEWTRTESGLYLRNKDIDGCKRVSTKIVNDIIEKGQITLDIMDLRATDDVTFSHSVNVAVYSCIIGMGMEYDEEVLSELVLASLLHDIGKLSIPFEIINKRGRLDPEEYRIIKSHSQRSYDFIRDRSDISDHVKQAILHHHENVDGSGYPDQLEGADQSIYMKILHVADVYDALISKRPYKLPYSPNEAVEYLMGASGIMFDSDVVNAFLKYVPLFPKGTLVRLSNGQVGIVSNNSDYHNLRPVITLKDHTSLDLYEVENLGLVILPLEPIGDAEIMRSEMERHAMLSSTGRRKLLIVDDMVTNLTMLREILEDQFDVILVKSGKQAINYIEKKGNPDLILMDIEMPEMDGIEAVSIIQKEYGDIPVLYVTARCDRETVMKCRDRKMAGYIVRPYQPAYVKSEVRRILFGRGDAE